MNKSALALILTLLSLNPAQAETTYFIQFWTSQNGKVYLDEGDTPGGVEVLKDGETVACAQASAIKDWNGDVLAPMSYGFTSKYPLKDLKFLTRGAVKGSVKLETKETVIDK
jgi:hypothetical protein